MNARKYVSISDYESVLEQLEALRLENGQLKRRLYTQEQLISEMRFSTQKIDAHIPKSESSWYKPPISPRVSTMRGRSGSLQNRQTYISRSSRNFAVNNLDSLTQEIQKAEKLKEKACEDLDANKYSPAKAERLRSIIERWEIEISMLHEKKDDFTSGLKFS